MFGYGRLSEEHWMIEADAAEELNSTYSMYPYEFTPFDKFLGMSDDITDEDYSSFLQAIIDLNQYFPLERFDKAAFFKEDNFHFENGSIYYFEPR